MTVPAGTGFVSQVPLDSTMKGGCIGQVVASRNAEFPVGAKTEGMTNWQTYCSYEPEVFPGFEQDIIDAQMGGAFREYLLRHDLPAEAFLQIVEGGHNAVPGNQQFAVEHCVESGAGQNIRKGAADVVAGAGVEPSLVAPGD